MPPRGPGDTGHPAGLSQPYGPSSCFSKGSLKVPVPVHGSRDLPTGLIKAISRQTGVKLP